MKLIENLACATQVPYKFVFLILYFCKAFFFSQIMTYSIEKITKALLNKLHIFPNEMKLWDGSQVTSWALYNYYYKIFFSFYVYIFNKSDHYYELLVRHLHNNINYDPEELFQTFLINHYIKDLYFELWDGSKVLNYKKVNEIRDIFFHRFFIVKNELLFLWNNNNYTEKNSRYFIQPVMENKHQSNIIVDGNNIFENDHVVRSQLFDGVFDWSSGCVVF
jgi:hypothetical protein